MGVAAYARRWHSFLGKYDHWRYLFAEWNKRMYLKSYLKHHSDADKERSMHHGARWLIHSINSGADRGSGTYYHHSGWTSAYPETTGYIIDTLLRYSTESNFPWAREARAAAEDAGQWLLSIQHEDGGWPGGYVHQQRPSVVFNTGQILRGLLPLYRHTGNRAYAEAAKRAIDWIWEQLDEQGQFSTNDFMGAVRVYGSYVVAPILDWLPEFPKCRDAWEAHSRRHLNWVLTQQNEHYWLANCDNTLHKNDRPIVHTIAYTLDGLFDAGQRLGEQRYLDAAFGGAEVLAKRFLAEGILHGRYDARWRGSEAFIPTGGAQLAILWHKIGTPWAVEARDTMNTLLSVVATSGARASMDVAGALPGSFPMWGRYESFGLPNWATKYLVDTLLNEWNAKHER
jgi:hypothetical protein